MTKITTTRMAIIPPTSPLTFTSLWSFSDTTLTLGRTANRFENPSLARETYLCETYLYIRRGYTNCRMMMTRMMTTRTPMIRLMVPRFTPYPNLLVCSHVAPYYTHCRSIETKHLKKSKRKGGASRGAAQTSLS
jgi:hypothetical protein